MEDMVYPGAQFLLEMDGFGGPMTPWRFYAVPDASGEQVAEYYKQQLSWFVIENDETINGIRYLMLAHPEPMASLNNVEDFEEIMENSRAMDGSLLGLEVSHSDIGAGLNRLGMAIDMHGIADQIPPNTTILILEYYQASWIAKRSACFFTEQADLFFIKPLDLRNKHLFNQHQIMVNTGNHYQARLIKLAFNAS
jgi:hypothetical protein